MYLKCFFILLSLYFCACTSTTITEEPITPKIEEELYKLIRETTFRAEEHPDYDSVYFNEVNDYTTYNNAFGQVNITLVPKTEKFNTYILWHFSKVLEEDKGVTQLIHSLSNEEISQCFDVLISVIDKKYLKKEKSDSDVFNHKILPYKEVTYLLKDGKWIKDAIFEVNSEKDENTAEYRRREYLNSLMAAYNGICHIENTTDFVKYIESFGKYILNHSCTSDFNKDGKDDFVFFFDVRENKDNYFPSIVILLSDDNFGLPEKDYKIFINSTFWVADFVTKEVVCKDEYFTIKFEFNSSSSYISYGDGWKKLTTENYVTFKYDKSFTGNFFLYHYRVVTNEDGVKASEDQYTTEVFGEMSFEDWHLDNMIEHGCEDD